MSERILIVNAEDLGRSDAINRGVIVRHEQRIVTSAIADGALAGRRGCGRLCSRASSLRVGLHLG